ncbi:hypothetical protein E4U55_003922 [Claviceps digitariae]|nr:hypothetical protein E4U55_003922 [Claviceps digitariae]
MPSVDVAMARSLRPPAWILVRDALARGVAQELSRRTIVDDTQTKITDVRTAFSSWDNCMKASFCKYAQYHPDYPSFLVVCLKCCGDCFGCCDPPGGHKTKSLDEPFIPPNNQGQGYHTQAPMQTNYPPPLPTKFQSPTQASAQPQFPPPEPAKFQPPAQAPMQNHFPPPEPAKFQSPQYATFDVSKKGSDDALPHMPTWEESANQKVLVKEDVEMSNLPKHPPTRDQTWQQSNPSPGPVSPMSTMSMNLAGQPHGDHYGSSSGQMPNHSQQSLVPNQQAMSYRQRGPGPGPGSGPGLAPGSGFAPGPRPGPRPGPGPGPGPAPGSGFVPGPGPGPARGPAPGSGFAPGPRPGPGPSPFGARDAEHHQSYNVNRHSDGFGLDEPYDEPSPMSSTTINGHSSQQTQLHDAPAQQPRDNLANQPFDVVPGADAGSYMGMRNQTVSPQHSQPRDTPPMGMRGNPTNSNNHQPYYGAPPNMGAAMAPGGRQSPAPAQGPAYRQNPYGQREVGQMAEMPANQPDHGSIRTPTHLRQGQTSPTAQDPPMELPGSVPPEAHGMRRPLPADNAAPVLDRPPLGQNGRMRNSPGPIQTPGPRGEGSFNRPPRDSPSNNQGPGRSSPQIPRDHDARMRNPPAPIQTSGLRGESPFGRPSRGSPINNQGPGRSSPQPPRDNANKSYSPAPPRQFAQDSERRFSPATERHNSPAAERQRAPAPHPMSRSRPPPQNNSTGPSSPPQSPITNNAGFDFTSGYSRPQGHQSPPGQSPTTAAYPGQRTYQPGRQFS